MALSAAETGGETNEERASREASWEVGAWDGGGGGAVLLKFVMDQRTMLCSLAALERMRSPNQDTL